MNVMNYMTRDVVTVAPEDSIDSAIEIMEQRGIHHLVVTQDGRAVGMLSDRDVLISTGWMFGAERRSADTTSGPTRIEQIMSRPVIGLDPSDSAKNAARLMLERRISATPILHDGRIIGLVTESDLLDWLDELGFGSTPAAQFLSRPVSSRLGARIVSVAPEAPVEDVIDIFRRFHVRHVPVIDMQHELLGVISDRDIRRALGWASVRDQQAQEEGRQSAEPPATAADIMQTNVLTVERTETLGAALRRMRDARTHCLPVSEAGRLYGIITTTDFMTALAEEELL